MTSAEIATGGAATVPSAPVRRLDAMEVGWQFVQEYYTILNKEPSRLHCFYNKDSVMLHGVEAESVDKCVGQQAIHKRFVELDFQKSKVAISNVDSMASLAGGILVAVLGELEMRGVAARKFSQTFLLAEQPNGYYVHNDIFRFLKEEFDDVADGVEEEAASYEQPQQHQQLHHHAEPAHVVHSAPSAFDGYSNGQAAAMTPPAAASVAAEPIANKRVVSSGWGSAPTPSHAQQQPATTANMAKKAPAAQPQPVVQEQKHSAPASPPKQQAAAPAKQVAAPAKQSPKVEPAPAPVSPPKTWASLADAGKERWAPHATPEVKAAVMPAEPSREQQRKQHQSAGKQQGGASNSSANSRQQQQRNDYPSAAVFIRGFAKSTKIANIKEDFAPIGHVRWVELLSDSTALLEFADASNVAKALAAGTVMVGGECVYIEDKEAAGPRRASRQSFRPQQAMNGGGNGNGSGRNSANNNYNSKTPQNKPAPRKQ